MESLVEISVKIGHYLPSGFYQVAMVPYVKVIFFLNHFFTNSFSFYFKFLFRPTMALMRPLLPPHAGLLQIIISKMTLNMRGENY